MDKYHLMEYLEAKIKDNPSSLFFARLADIYISMGRVDDAIEICLQGLERHPSYVTGHFILGKAFVLKEDPEKAEAEFKKVLAHDRQHLSAHKYLGDLMARMGWENKAALHYKEILQLDPGEEESRKMLDTFSLSGPQAAEISKPVSVSPEEVFPPQNQQNWTEDLDDIFPPDSVGPVEERYNRLQAETSLSDGISQEEHASSDNRPEKGMSGGADEGSSQTTGHVSQPDDKIEVPSETASELTSALPENGSQKYESMKDLEPPIESSEWDMETEPAADLKPPKEEAPLSALPNEIPLDYGDESKPDEKSESEEQKISENFLKEIESIFPDEGQDQRFETALTTEGPEKPGEKRPTREKESPDQKIISPTLGEIYTAQGQYSKAIRVYEMLLLKYPGEERYQKKITELKKKLSESQ